MDTFGDARSGKGELARVVDFRFRPHRSSKLKKHPHLTTTTGLVVRKGVDWTGRVDMARGTNLSYCQYQNRILSSTIHTYPSSLPAVGVAPSRPEVGGWSWRLLTLTLSGASVAKAFVFLALVL